MIMVCSRSTLILGPDSIVLKSSDTKRGLITPMALPLVDLIAALSIYIERTFSYCTKYFYQLFIVYGVQKNWFTPNGRSWRLRYAQDGFQFKSEEITAILKWIHQAVRVMWYNSNLSGRNSTCHPKIRRLILSATYCDKTSDTVCWLGWIITTIGHFSRRQ